MLLTRFYNKHVRIPSGAKKTDSYPRVSVGKNMSFCAAAEHILSNAVDEKIRAVVCP